MNRGKRRTALTYARHVDQGRVIQPAEQGLLRALFNQWEPERPELLIRLRPRLEEASRVTH